MISQLINLTQKKLKLDHRKIIIDKYQKYFFTPHSQKRRMGLKNSYDKNGCRFIIRNI
jgi:hypothetical protein